MPRNESEFKDEDQFLAKIEKFFRNNPAFIANADLERDHPVESDDPDADADILIAGEPHELEVVVRVRRLVPRLPRAMK